MKFLSFIFALLAGLVSQASAAESVDYLKDIKPLLAENCYKCHGASAQKGGLRLDTAVLAVKGGDAGTSILPGKGAESLLVKAVEGTARDLDRMPLKKPALSGEKIALLKLWIDQGAKAPADERSDDGHSPGSVHWAFVPPIRQPDPKVNQADWPRNSIDNFILARLEKEKIKPSVEADRITLIRRVSLDLTGLPPKPAEVEAFLQDKSPNAYEKLVDRLLASPHYGERWGRHWLDIARYADSNGYSVDSPRSIWKYRDWVIEAMNRDLPFDQFTIDQLAGDMLPNATIDQRIATGFHRNTMINEEGGIDKEQFRIESILDRVNTTGSAFLGLTIGCSQCHDHKFDPLLQKEYYQMFAFLNNADEPTLEVASPSETAQRESLKKQIKESRIALKKYEHAQVTGQMAWEKSLTPELMSKLKPEVKTNLLTEVTQRTDKQKSELLETFLTNDANFKKYKTRIADLEKAEKEIKSPTTMVMQERAKPRESYIFIKGDFTRHGNIVTPGVPHVLPPLANTNNPNRLDLAKWIIDPQNPLPARVTVNRMWVEYFGKGLVETENDFGSQGAPPSHPELLDWLATEFIKQKWSMKAMHRLIVTSATYRQASHVRPELAIIDPNNKLLARQSRLRLDAEVVRDVALSASGVLNETIGGPSVYPPLPEGVMNLGQSNREWKSETGANRYRRGMYTFFWRATPHPDLIVFDAPDATSACTRRMRSNTPLQSLTLLNDQGFFELAQALATRVLKEAPQSSPVDYAFQLCLARKPSQNEKQRLEQLLSHELSAFEQSPADAKTITPKSSTGDIKQLAAWTTVSRVLLNLDETITRE